MTQFDARIKSKHDTTQRWNNATGFIPLAGEIIIYDDHDSKTVENNGVPTTVYIPGVKIGDGLAYVQDLPFVDDYLRDTIMTHINNVDIHVTTQDKSFWNNKLNMNDSYDIHHGTLQGETLVFNRD